VTSETVEPCIDVLSRWQRIDKENNRPWLFIITSNGGEVIAGIKLYSLLKAIGQNRPIITVASGMCASIATVIHQAGTERVIEPACSYLLHDVSGGLGGSLSSMQDTMGWLKMINTRLHVALAEKSNQSVEEIAALCERRDAWFMAEEIVAMGLADRVGYAIEPEG
jgi:ATP-dependent Clp protease protease subunit